MRNFTVFVGLLIFLSVVSPSIGLLLPWMDRSENPVSDRFNMDPFKILEHVPFGLDRDDVSMVSLAKVDWRETANSHEIVIDVPGIRKEDLKIELEDDRILRVSGERKREEEDKKGDHYHRVERSYGKFWRQFRLPDNADLESVTADLQHGVLTVKFAKLAPEKIKGPRVVSIGGGEEGMGKIESGGEGKSAKKVEL